MQRDHPAILRSDLYTLFNFYEPGDSFSYCWQTNIAINVDYIQYGSTLIMLNR